jgi:flagellum-specific ATP synthase
VIPWTQLLQAVGEVDLTPVVGRVLGAAGLIIESAGPKAKLNELCHIRGDDQEIPAEVVGFREDKVLLMPLAEVDGLRPGWQVHGTGGPLRAPTGDGLLGRVLDGLGKPMDGLGALGEHRIRPVTGLPPTPLLRQRITQPVSLGVRALIRC